MDSKISSSGAERKRDQEKNFKNKCKKGKLLKLQLFRCKEK